MFKLFNCVVEVSFCVDTLDTFVLKVFKSVLFWAIASSIVVIVVLSFVVFSLFSSINVFVWSICLDTSEIVASNSALFFVRSLKSVFFLFNVFLRLFVDSFKVSLWPSREDNWWV